MVTSRILLILCAPLDAASAAATVARAVQTAARPLALRFALPSSLANASALSYDEAVGWADVLPQLTDETHFLVLSGEHAFVPRWDQLLLRTLPARALLTATLSPAPLADAPKPLADDAPTVRLPTLGSGLAALRQSLPELEKRRAASIRLQAPAAASVQTASQAYLPALKEGLSEDRVTLGRGLALVCAAEPVKTLVIDPNAVFGPIDFLYDCHLDPATLTMAAYVSGYAVYALHEAWFWPLVELPERQLVRPPISVLPGTTLARIEQLLGFHYGQAHSTGKAAMGLMGAEETYAQRMPSKLIFAQKRRLAAFRLKDIHMPLVVSAFLDLPNQRHTPAYGRLRFGFLSRLSCLPLTLFTGGSQERALRAAFPHTQSYPDHRLLPRTLLNEGMSEADHFARSKPLLMLRAAKKQTEFSHIAWLDPDVLPHPLCVEAVPDIRPLMDDRVHLAVVGGVPDASFLLIPRTKLNAVAREVLSITQLDAELKRGFDEALLWERLFLRKPDWFALHPMPRRRLLFLSLFDRPLLSRSLQSQLGDPAPAHYASQADLPARRTKPKELNP